MKILAVSDIVNRKLYGPYVKELAGKVDVIVSCGDLPDYYLDYLVSSLSIPLLYICGNHDHYDSKRSNTFVLGDGSRYFNVDLDYNKSGSNFGGKNIDNRVEIINQVIFSGLEGSLLYNKGEHQYSQRQMGSKIRRLAPSLWWNKLKYGRYLDVLITHAPPWGIHDRSDLPHQGFKSFLTFIKKYRPRYLLHGHTHIYDINEKRELEHLGTKVVNCYDYQIIDLEK